MKKLLVYQKLVYAEQIFYILSRQATIVTCSLSWRVTREDV